MKPNADLKRVLLPKDVELEPFFFFFFRKTMTRYTIYHGQVCGRDISSLAFCFEKVHFYPHLISMNTVDKE